VEFAQLRKTILAELEREVVAAPATITGSASSA